jgi:hypothetical protein
MFATIPGALTATPALRRLSTVENTTYSVAPLARKHFQRIRRLSSG